MPTGSAWNLCRAERIDIGLRWSTEILRFAQDDRNSNGYKPGHSKRPHGHSERSEESLSQGGAALTLG